jgi:hypothetical protein
MLLAYLKRGFAEFREKSMITIKSEAKVRGNLPKCSLNQPMPAQKRRSIDLKKLSFGF